MVILSKRKTDLINITATLLRGKDSNFDTDEESKKLCIDLHRDVHDGRHDGRYHAVFEI